MKDSGIDWIGKIPDEWIVSKAKTILHNKTVKNHPNAEVLSLYRDLGVVPKNSRDDNHNVTSEDTSSYKFVQKGELVLNKMKTWQGSLAVSNYEGIVSHAYYVCEFINNEIDKNYIHYLLRNKMYAQEFERLSTGLRVGQWDLSIEDFLNTLIIYPPSKSEQTRIANFLDEKCAQIDSIIEESKKSIEEYKAWKQSVIFEAVTGKNLSCKKKNSGIEWISEIPETWEVRALKTIFRIFSGTTPKSDIIEYWDGDVNWVTPADFKTEDVYVENGKRNISENGFSDCSLELIPINSLIFSKRAPIGKVCINRNEMCTNQGCLACVKKINLSIKFFYYLLSSLTEYFEVLGSGTTFKEISLTSFSDFKVLFPPLSEQESIVKFLDAKCAQIDSLISEKQSLIQDLADYKKSLIFEAVTGKRRV